MNRCGPCSRKLERVRIAPLRAAEDEMSEQRDAAVDLSVCAAATEGPWEFDVQTFSILAPHPSRPACQLLIVDGEHDAAAAGGNTVYSAADGEHIATSREALPHWICRAVTAEQRVRTATARAWKCLPRPNHSSYTSRSCNRSGMRLRSVRHLRRNHDRPTRRTADSSVAEAMQP